MKWPAFRSKCHFNIEVAGSLDTASQKVLAVTNKDAQLISEIFREFQGFVEWSIGSYGRQ